MNNPKKYFILTYGCQMNELDSEIMAGILEQKGYIQADHEKEADIIIMNTCSIRDLAERKALGKMGKLMKKRSAERPLFGLAGCMATLKKEELFKKLPCLDFVLGTNNIHELDTIIDHYKTERCAAHPLFQKELNYAVAKRKDPLKAFVSISRGCNNFCTYCVVPYTRGREVSRSQKSIVDECKQLVDKGYKEITLLGQNVNSWGNDKPENQSFFPDLLEEINEIDGLLRLRFLTSHPKDISKELMQAVGSLDKVCEYVHFPFQSGSDAILKKMNRSYTRASYLEKVAALKSYVPEVAIGTDIIVGFPGEGEKEFEETYSLLEELQCSQSFIFVYSPRKGTPAYRWKDQMEEKAILEERHQRLLQLYNEIVQKDLEQLIGKEVEVFIESTNGTQLKGKTRTFKSVVCKGNSSLIGTLQKVRIDAVKKHTLIGSLRNNLFSVEF